MRARDKARRAWQTRIGRFVILVTVLVISAGPSIAWGRPHGFRGHHRFRHPHVFIAPRVVVPFGPYWEPSPSAYPYIYPPAVVQPSPQVYVQLPPSQQYWYYCDDPPGYYPYVQECPTGWRAVAPTPP
jgi:hypothetical protein